MSVSFVTPQKYVNNSYKKVPVLQADMEQFASALLEMDSNKKVGESEENYKNLIAQFLHNSLYSEYKVNTKGRIDLAISGDTNKPLILIEAKAPQNKAEMLTTQNINIKALQEILYYFTQEYYGKEQNREIKKLVITNYDTWFIFDAKDLADSILRNKTYAKQFDDFENKRLTSSDTAFFYSEIAKPAIETFLLEKNIKVATFNIENYVQAAQKKDYDALLPLYRLLNPTTMLNLSFTNDSNSLNKEFYNELLHLIGLEEVKDGGKKLIQRKPEEKRNAGSLLESTIYQLEDEVSKEKIFDFALRLCITWINRLLFLKLVEAQQISYQKGNTDYRFLTTDKIDGFDELNTLFFKVLGKPVSERDNLVKEKYAYVPYLNSSLFETSIEEETLKIRGIQNRPLEIYSQTVLLETSTGNSVKRKTGSMDNLEYILSFLDAYDFSSEGKDEVKTQNKTIINASVLGLIFEKINGYKDGSFFTPGYITEYIAKETLERTVIQKFNDVKGWSCKTLSDVADKIEDKAEANQIMNSIKVCDPAVGSGHFLVSALNRLLAIKSELNIFFDASGKRIKNDDWRFIVENDELLLIDDEGKIFSYTMGDKTYQATAKQQLIQQAIFTEKRTVIENCLFGVDINPNSVYICRLRLWIELLKNTYYTEQSGFESLETLPNIDINIKCGNSLVSKYKIELGKTADFGNVDGRTETGKLFTQYRELVADYKNSNSKETKKAINKQLRDIKKKILPEEQLSLFEEENEEINKNNIYKNSMEWMIEFPEVLDDDGKFLGFDAVIGNPPYGIFNKKQNQKIGLSTDDMIIDLIRKRFPSADEGMINAAKVFYAMGFSLIHKTGYEAMIIPFGILADTSSVKLRKDIFINHSFVKIEAFPERDTVSRRVFDDAKMSTAILISSAKHSERTFDIGVSFNKEIAKKHAKFLYKDILEFSPENLQIPMCDKKTFDLLKRLRGDNYQKLGDISKCLTGELDMTKGKTSLQLEKTSYLLVKGVQIDRYIFKTRKEEISQGEIQYVDIEKFQPLCTSEKLQYSKLERLSFQGLSGINEKYRLKGVIVPSGCILANSSNFLVLNNSISKSFLLALFNSKLLNFIFKATSTSSNVNGYEIDALPYRHPTDQQPFITLADQILAAKKQNPAADTSTLESEIDTLVRVSIT